MRRKTRFEANPGGEHLRIKKKKRRKARSRSFSERINSYTRRNDLISKAKAGDVKATAQCLKDYGLTIYTKAKPDNP